MNHDPHAWWDFGYAGIFVCVFLDQIGVPIPAFPALLAAGALVSSGKLSLMGCLIVAVVAGMVADIIWYGIGRAKGARVLHLMCRLSWTPDSCVSQTKILFLRHGTKTLLVSKFVPGLDMLAPPLAGMTRIPISRFISFDTIGTTLWVLTPLLAGVYLQGWVGAFQSQTSSLPQYLLWICGTMILGVLAWRYWNRRRYLKKQRHGTKNGITSEQLKQLMDQGEDIVVLDIRNEINARAEPSAIPGAQWVPYSTLTRSPVDIPLDKSIIVYCDCPKDQASIEISLRLRKAGANRVRPLLKGLEGWKDMGFSTESLTFATHPELTLDGPETPSPQAG